MNRHERRANRAGKLITRILTCEEAANAIIAIERQPNAEHLLCIYRAVAERRLGYVIVPQGAEYKALPESALGRPLLFLVGDDLQEAKGPEGFDAITLRRVFDGAGHVVLNAADTNPAFYQLAVEFAVLGQKAVLIETRPDFQDDWLACVTQNAPEAGVTICSPNAPRNSRFPFHDRSIKWEMQPDIFGRGVQVRGKRKE